MTLDSAIQSVTFDRSAMPANLLTVQDWRVFASNTGHSNWRSAARYYASIRGGALVLRASGDLVCFTRRDDRVAQTTYRAGRWSWDS